MNFIFQDREKIDTYLNQEVVIVINSNILNNKVILNFPEDRFSNFNEKYESFLKKIKGTEKFHEENNYKYISSAEKDYTIYEEFFLTFY